MNLIVVMLDSFRQDHIGLYHQGRAAFPGVAPCATPNLDRFARDAIVFDNMYPEGLPTLPVRMTTMTGQSTLPYRDWQPLGSYDLTLAEILSREGYVSGLISDCYHFRAPGMNYHRGFTSYRWIRGQEYDPYESGPPRRSVGDYVNDHYPEIWRRRIEQFLANTDNYQREEDWFPARVVDEAISWLKTNRSHKRKFLWVDSFDPHEPWDPPARFDTYGDPSYKGKRLIMPMGGMYEKWATPAEARHIQSLYAGEASFVDYWLGKLFAAFEEHGYLEDSAIVVMADHGHPLGDHGKFLKGADRMYSELLKVPFIVRMPGGRNGGRRVHALAQFQDLLPTALDVLGLGASTGATSGLSFRAVLEGDSDEHRPATISGYHEGRDRCVRDKRWSLILRPEGEPDELYDLAADPGERNNLIDAYPEEAKRLARAFGSIYFRARRSNVIKGVQGKYEMASGSVE